MPSPSMPTAVNRIGIRQRAGCITKSIERVIFIIHLYIRRVHTLYSVQYRVSSAYTTTHALSMLPTTANLLYLSSRWGGQG